MPVSFEIFCKTNSITVKNHDGAKLERNNVAQGLTQVVNTG